MTLLAGLLGAGRLLIVDNWYTLVELAMMLAASYSTYMIGTYTPRKGKPSSSTAHLFQKLKDSVAKLAKRGWGRVATTTISAVEVLAMLRKDMKVVGFVATWFVARAPAGCTVRRRTKTNYDCAAVPAHPLIGLYAMYNGAVDRADRGIADVTINRHSKRWYMPIAYWVPDAVLGNM